MFDQQRDCQAPPPPGPRGQAGPRRAWVPGAALLVVALAAAAPARAQYGWSWGLDAARYKKLNMFQRKSLEKANKLFRDGKYRVAAKEYEKFNLEFPDTQVLSHVMFMMARGQHLSRDRHTAIKSYQEVLDYFGDEVDDAAPAIYWMANAHFENGDMRKGLETYQKMVEDERYQTHPLAAGALRTLADNHWKNGKYALAVRWWKQTVRDFAKTNPGEAGRARGMVVAWYLNARNYKGFEKWYMDADRAEDAPYRKGVTQYVIGMVNGLNGYPVMEGQRTDEEHRREDRKILYDYVRANRKWWKKTKDDWGWWMTQWRLAGAIGNTTDAEEALSELVKLIKLIKDDRVRDGKWRWFIGLMFAEKNWGRATICIGYITDRMTKEWTIKDFYQAQEKMLMVEKQLIKIEKIGHGTEHEKRAVNERAGLYQGMGRYKEAITLYHQISDPPRTLYRISECYWGLKEMEKTLTTLVTIENMFPPEGPNAAWLRTGYLKSAGEKKRAVAEAARILKVYKESSQSAAAHDLLEKWGIDTKGGTHAHDEF